MSQIVEELLEEHDRLAAQLTEERASNASHVAALQSSIAKLEASGAQKDFQIAQLDAFCQRCTCQPDVKEALIPDWETGLPLELLALVAGLGGRNEMKAMRGVCKLWKEGFEEGTTGLAVGPEGPLLPTDGSFCKRFPMLANLALGDSPVAEEDLNLSDLRHLRTLSLGTERDSVAHASYPGALFSRLNGMCFGYLLGPNVTDLNLHCCSRLRSLEGLKELPLTRLDLSGLGDDLPRIDLASVLCGVSLTSLDISGLESSCILDFLNGVWKVPTIRALEMEGDSLEDIWLQPLADLPLTTLNLSQYPPGQGFDMWAHFGNFTGAGLEYLMDMPLTSLNLSGCARLEDESLAFLKGLPLKILDLTGCTSLRDAGWRVLGSLKVQSLSLGGCDRLSDDSIKYLVDLPLTNLSLNSCRRLSGDALKYLAGMSLKELDVGGCTGLIDTDLGYLASMPLASLILSGCSALTGACVEELLVLPHLKSVELADCGLVSYLASAELKWKGVKVIR